jgi:predicted nucleic acid-binding protein
LRFLNTAPLRYLIAIRHEHLFEKLFGKIIIPNAGFDELPHPGTPESVRRFISSRPAWLKVRSANYPSAQSLPPLRHRGESEALALAEALSADLLPIDERHGRAAVQTRNLRPSGTLGVLEAADSLGLIEDFPQVLDELKTAGFFLRSPLETLLLRRYDDRKGDK